MIEEKDTKDLVLLRRLYTKIGALRTEAPIRKVHISYEIVATVKEAALGNISLPTIASAAKRIATSPFAKGLGVAAGASIPTYLVGSKLIDEGTDQMRNKALQVAGGTALMAGGLYGLHRALGPSGGAKQASAEVQGTVIKKLSSAMYLQELLGSNAFSNTLTEKIAGDLKDINACYVADLVSQLLN